MTTRTRVGGRKTRFNVRRTRGDVECGTPWQPKGTNINYLDRLETRRLSGPVRTLADMSEEERSRLLTNLTPQGKK